MKLYLVQHGEAAVTDADPERQLTQQGRADVQRIGAFLQRAGISAQRVLHSGKLRAKQTAAILADAIAPDCELETSNSISPLDEVAPFAGEIDAWNEDVLVVGHLPFMPRLVSYLLMHDADRMQIAYTPGSIVSLERSGIGVWTMSWMLRPELFRG